MSSTKHRSRTLHREVARALELDDSLDLTAVSDLTDYTDVNEMPISSGEPARRMAANRAGELWAKRTLDLIAQDLAQKHALAQRPVGRAKQTRIVRPRAKSPARAR